MFWYKKPGVNSYFRRVSSSCSTSGTNRVNSVKNLATSHEQGKDRIWLQQTENINVDL